ncbi:MAG: M20 family metallo-hydrolase [Desulfovibrio sp.]|nr:M20 family metallo-hydrolase [Desulfovibrio sp.]
MPQKIPSTPSLLDLLASQEARDLVIQWQKALTASQAIPPEQNGDGEAIKCALLEKWLINMEYTPIHYDAPDPRVSAKVRPNILCTVQGELEEKLWLFAHLDVVTPGDRNAWKYDPFSVHQEGDYLIGRGVEDNQQAIVSMLLLLWALQKTKTKPRRTICFVFMADEETGSKFGLVHLLKLAPNLFDKNDFYLVPDCGHPKATLIEIAEKGQLWVKIITRGVQCHASTPGKGKNAFVAASALVTTLAQRLPTLFAQRNDLFDPPTSTFVPSKHEANVDGINIVPGSDIFYLDCRLLPGIDQDSVLQAIDTLAQTVAKEKDVSIELEVVQKQNASALDIHHPAITELSMAVSKIYGQRAFPQGIGGGTVAAYLRMQGLPALVWACIENTCHAPNERSSITATIKDSQVFALLALKN